MQEGAMTGRRLHPQERIDEDVGRGWWTGETVQQLLADRVAERGDALAVLDPPDKAAPAVVRAGDRSPFVG
jgi:non-ribosomal peptide synthetase component E (peptide arylation enzyme)